MTDDPAVSVVGVRVELGRRTVLQDVNLMVRRGEVVGVVGANGSGKSTLLRLIVGLVRPRAGAVRLFGLSPHDPCALRRIGAVIDAPALYPWMSGRSVLRTLLDLSGEADRGRSREALGRFGLSAMGRRLSSGDFGPALEQFLGSGAGLSASSVVRLTQAWQGEAAAFNTRRSTTSTTSTAGSTAVTSRSGSSKTRCACW